MSELYVAVWILMQRWRLSCVSVVLVSLSGLGVTQAQLEERDQAGGRKPVVDPFKGMQVQTLTFNDPDDLEKWDLIGGGWKQHSDAGQDVLSLFKKESDHQPTFRSPLHLALWKTPVAGPFRMDIKVRSTHPDYGHRDVVFYLNYQNPDQFYYVHLAKATDDHANQVFIVNRAARKKISTTTSAGTPWDDAWHTVRIERDDSAGTIKVFFDDMTQPVMTATDKTFQGGRIGVGSFDDTADFQQLEIWSNQGQPPVQAGKEK